MSTMWPKISPFLLQIIAALKGANLALSWISDLSVEEANKLRDAYGFGSKDRNSIEGNESVFVRKLREQGVIIKSDGSGNGLMGVPIDQTKIGSEVDKYLCPFSSALGMGKAISGDGVLTLSETKKQYKVSVEKGYIEIIRA